MKKADSIIRKDILNRLERLFPNDKITMEFVFDENYFDDLEDDIREKFIGIESSVLDYERDRESGRGAEYNVGEGGWSDGYDDYDGYVDEPSPEEDIASSYHLYFLALKDRRFHFESNSETIDEDENIIEVKGHSKPGCCVAVSVLAPYASISFDAMGRYEEGGAYFPDIDAGAFVEGRGPVDMAEVVRDNAGEKAVQALRELADEIARILDSFGIEVLAPEELEKSVPWLESGGGVFLYKEIPGESFKLRDALFHRGVC